MKQLRGTLIYIIASKRLIGYFLTNKGILEKESQPKHAVKMILELEKMRRNSIKIGMDSA